MDQVVVDAVGENVLFAVALRTLARGREEPVALAGNAREVLHLASRLVDMTGKLREAVGDVLVLAASLEGRGDSPRAARGLYEAIGTAPECRRALGLAGDWVASDERALRALAKKRMRRNMPPSAPRLAPLSIR